MYLWRIILNLFFSFSCYAVAAQVQVNVTVLNGNANTLCGDLVGQPDHVWGVNVNNQGWTDYISESNCPNFFTAPNLQYITSFGCPLDFASALEICFRAYENDPGFFTPCNYDPDNCMEEVCASFPMPTLGRAVTYTLSLPSGGTATGQVEFQIEVIGEFPGGQNDVTCSAIDLGILPVGGKLGDASIGTYNNYCGTLAPREANPADSQASWNNDAGVWFTFTTSDQPGQKIIIRSKSDPQLMGDDIFLQIGLFDAPNQNCSDNLRYLIGSGVSTNDFQQDETVVFQCDRRLLPNTRYYILIDGFTRAPEDIYGIFGLEVEDVPLVPALLKDTICAGSSYQLFGNNYVLSGIYVDTLRLPAGCDSVVQLDLTVLEPITIQINQTQLASAKSNPDAYVDILVEGDSGNYGVFWSDNGIGNSRTDLIGGQTYSVQVIDEYGCNASVSFTVAYSNSIIASAIGDTLTCFGDENGRIVLRATNGKPPYNFIWQSLENSEFKGEGTIRDTLGFAGINGLTAGNYEITFVDSINGDVQVEAQVVAPSRLAFEVIEQRDASCFGSCDALLQFAIQGGTAPYVFDFNEANFDSLSQTLSNLCAGAFTSIVTDANFCSAIFKTIISEPKAIEFLPAEVVPVSCFGGNDGQVKVYVEEPSVEFIWNTGQSGNQIVGLAAGNYSVTATNARQCKDSLQVAVSEPISPFTVNIIVEQPILCHNSDDGKLSAKVNGEYQQVNLEWNTGSRNTQIENLVAGTYQLSIVNEKGCSAADTITLIQPDSLIFSISSRDLSCAGDSLFGAIWIQKVDGGTPPYLFSLDGVRFSPNNRFENLEEGTYDVVIQDANTCEWTEDTRLLGTSALVLDAGEDSTIRLGDSILLSAISNSDRVLIDWQDENLEACKNCQQWMRQPTRTQFYKATALDTITQCKAVDWVEIGVEISNLLYVPNAFSPNQDNINDEFSIVSSNAIKHIVRLSIFDRFGTLVYQLANVTPTSLNEYGWDGMFKGKALPSSIYVYILEIELINNQFMLLEGDIFLVK